jgi:hypothetical protein
MEPGRMFFDVSFQRYKALMDEVGYFFVAV